jgi:hypothetical protein
MSLIARTNKPIRVVDGNDVFDLTDGERQVTAAEGERLKRLLGSRVTIEKETSSRKSSETPAPVRTSDATEGATNDG